MKRRGSGRRLTPRGRRAGSLHLGLQARRTPAWLGIAGLCFAMMAMATPADAASAPPGSAATLGRATSAVAPALVAGYLSAPAAGLATASLRFKVPKLKCTEGEPRAVTIGLGDVQDPESPQLRAHVVLTCPAEGPAQYTFAVQACSHSAGPLVAKRGHNVSVALAQSGGSVTMTVTDEDEAATISVTDSTANCGPPGSLDSVLFGAFPVFAPSAMDVPDFKKVKARDTTLNGADLRGERVDRQTDPGIKTTKLKKEPGANLSAGSRKSGDTFSMKYRDVVHCCLQTPAPAGAAPRAG